MNNKELLSRIDYLLDQGASGRETKFEDDRKRTWVKHDMYMGFRLACLSFIHNLVGQQHPYYTQFNNAERAPSRFGHLTEAIAILKAIRNEIEQGWLTKLTQLVSADIFSNFMEMAEHLFENNYKDAAAVIIGSTLEEHLRLLCNNNGVETTTQKGEDSVPKKAETLNVDLKAAAVYTGIEQKQVTAWLGIRNSAAHGKYGDYTKEQVALMYQGVLNFISNWK
jgi:hypothetical protein